MASTVANELTLREYRTVEGVPLEPETAAELLAYAPKLVIQPSYRTGRFDLSASSWIGVIKTTDLALTIAPKLPMRRLYFLITYALDPGAWRKELFDFAEDASLIEVLAPGFARQASRAIRMGLLQGYREREEALLTVKGRIRFGDQIRERFGRAPPVEVSYDEFTEDTDENRILRAAVERLLRLPIRSTALRRRLRGIRWALRDVSVVDFHRRPVPGIRYTRLNEHYRPAIRIAELILAGSSLRHAHGTARSSCFLLDMNDVFERFVRIGLREALGANRFSFPRPENMPVKLWLDRGRSVRLKPDLSLWVNGRAVFVGDVKYKWTGSSGENSDVYQALAYSVATGLDSAMLIYARGEREPAELVIERAGKTLHVVALDLDKEPEGMLEQLREIGRRVRVSAEVQSRGLALPACDPNRRFETTAIGS